MVGLTLGMLRRRSIDQLRYILRRLLGEYHYPHILESAMNFVKVEKIPGDYYEFGVYQGQTFIRAYREAKRLGLNQMRFFAFDSFQGLPEIKGLDTFSNVFTKGSLACGLDEFKRILRIQGVDLLRVGIIPGWFDQTLNARTREKWQMESAAVVWVDCDLYESAKYVMEFITPLVQDGTVIIFDDWFSFKGNPSFGEQRACREWLQQNPQIKLTEFHKYYFNANSFIVYKTEL